MHRPSERAITNNPNGGSLSLQLRDQKTTHECGERQTNEERSMDFLQ